MGSTRNKSADSLRKRAEEELRERERYLSAILRTTADGFCVIDAEGHIADVNDAYCAMSGYARDELIGSNIHEMDAMEMERETGARIRRIIEKGSELFETRQRRKDGSIWPVEVSTTYLPERGGQIICFCRDLTERKQREGALKQHSHLLEHSPDAIYVSDTDGHIIYANSAAIRQTGFASDEIVGKSVWEIDADFPALEYGALFSSLPESGAVTLRTVHCRKDGTRFPVEITLSKMTHEGVSMLCGIARDMTDRRQREERITLLSRMLDEAPAAITIHDSEGHFLYANRATYTLHGYDSPDDFLSVNLHNLDVPESEVLVEERMRMIIETGAARFEVVHCRKDGSTFPLDVMAKTIDWHGQPAILSIAVDIADRKRMEHQNRILAQVVNRSRDFVGVADMDSHPIYVNPAGQSMVGLDGDAAVAETTIEDYFMPEDLPFVRNTVLPTLMETGRWAGELRFRHFKTGLPVHVLYDLFLTEDPGAGKPKQITTITRDISERKKVEEALRESEQRLQSVFRSVPVGIGVVVNRVFRHVNQRVCEISGYSESELLGRNSRMLYPSDEEYERVGSEKYEQIRRLGSGTVETRWQRKDGALLHVLLSSTPIDPDDLQKGVTFTAMDITERKKTEEELRRRENMLQRIFEILPIGLWFADKDGMLLRGNPAGVRIWGAEPHIPMSEYGIFRAWRLPSREPVTPGDWALARTIRDGVTILDELLEIESFDGKRKTILNSSTPVIDANGNVEGAIVVNLDITERHVLEEQLRQAQKMESIGRLAGGVAHDFNNMLNVILGHAELMMEEVPADSSLHADLMEIRGAAERSANLTRQLLAFARKQTVSPRILDLNETVSGMLNMLGRLIGEDIELIWQPGSEVWPVNVDPSQIDQIMANLCVNARDAISDIGSITIRTQNRMIDEAYCTLHPGSRIGRFVMIAVSDTGCGMESEILSHIFEPFFTTKGIGKGTGLGLATVYGAVQQNEGFILIESNPGQGSTFSVYLPRYAEKAESLSRTVAEAPAQGRETILLVEDEPAILNLSRRMLERLGYEVLTAATPGAAIRLAREHHGDIHLLITDVVMPEMNGRDLAKRLLSLYPDMKRLFMSGYTADIIAHHGVLEEGVHFIQKPFTVESLAKKIRETLGGEM